MKVQIQSFKHVAPMIYAYNTPGVTYHEGWTKIGYTEKQTVEERVRQQTRTAGLKYKISWQDFAQYKDGSGIYFTDHDFHAYLQRVKGVKRESGSEWFQIDGKTSYGYFTDFAMRRDSDVKEETYILRKEQAEAVEKAKKHFENGGKQFLWNAKPRFGKTLAAYDLMLKMKAVKVLVVTNRPSIANSWADDFNKFIGWHGTYGFVSETDSLKGKPGVLTRDEHMDKLEELISEGIVYGLVAFESLQGLKGSIHFGGNYDKLKWISDLTFDLLIVDESQEGVDTYKTEWALKNLRYDHVLFLSGTPFKQLASGEFSADEIFNWSYEDEQEAKENWSGDGYNPYERLPRLSMFTYQLSNMIMDTLSKGLDLADEDENVDYFFDLNEFFATDERNGKFIHEEEIKKFLHALVSQEKYPFSTPQLRKELSHTLWLLSRVASAKALAKLLKEDPVFGEYEIIIAAGDGKSEEDDDSTNVKAYNRVKEAIAKNDKTITLSVGQLTVGVTIPEWSGVLMLCNLASASAYMQAAFRAQNPCSFTGTDNKRYRKENAYVFDFDPSRTLIIFDEFANNLRADTANGSGTSEDRRENIKRLLNFFPVLGEDSEGRMVELDAAEILSIPRRLKCQEVVRRGFMSNFLFQNISNIFGAPGVVKAIIEKIEPAKEESKGNRENDFDGIEDVPVDDHGEVEIPEKVVIGKTQDIFGDKIFDIQNDVQKPIEQIIHHEIPDEVVEKIDAVADDILQTVKNRIVEPIADAYERTQKDRRKLEKDVENEFRNEFRKIKDEYKQNTKVATVEFEKARKEAQSKEQLENVQNEYKAKMDNAFSAMKNSLETKVEETVSRKPQELVEKIERQEKEAEKKGYEDKVRDHLRGFSRTIPSFIMAYGDENLTLANFDDYTEDDVFEEVTGISEADFRFLRDGGDYVDPETGAKEFFAGHLFDETVFNDSIQEFLNKKKELANYFDETLEEDIFDYIPPQKTNQIFTPRRVVEKMVDLLEENNPGCFDNPDHTFADLYMKSGLYITEIVKRLFRSKKMKKLFPDDRKRIQHILRNQVYGMAPSRIIYLIATNYILGFDENLKRENTHFVEEDAAEASKNGVLQEVVDKHFGKMTEG